MDAHAVAPGFRIIERREGDFGALTVAADAQHHRVALRGVNQIRQRLRRVFGIRRCAVDVEDDVARLKPRGVRRAALLHVRDEGFRARHAANPEVQHQHHQRQQEVHARPHQHRQHPLPNRLLAERARVVRGFALHVVLAVECAVPAQRNAPQREFRPGLSRPSDDFRPEANRELHDLYPRHAREDVMPKFMHRNQDSQQQQRHQHRNNCHSFPF